MKATYRHTNIVAADWRALSRFYQEVFGCVPVPPERDLSGPWLDRGTGVGNARVRGAHLRLPGHGDKGPTLEIFQYAASEPRSPAAANREGIAHLAFEVEDVERAASAVIVHGGRKIGEIASSEVTGVGLLTFVYLADPEGNIVELLSWRRETGKP
jgi:catechol 2,3-dioxygenase-like lactoylglutathione lyase family enzyme